VSDAGLIEHRVMVVGEGEDARGAASALMDAGYPVVTVAHPVANGDSLARPGSRIASVQGYVGRFLVRLDGPDMAEVEVGAIALALGNQRAVVDVGQPEGSLLPVLTPLGWAARVREDLRTEYRVAWAQRRVILLLDYPENTSKETAAEALRVTQDVVGLARPEVCVYYRDLQVDTHNLERLTRSTRELGVVYCRYHKLELAFEDDQVVLTSEEGRRVGDVLVVPERIAPPAAARELAEKLGIRLGEDGLLQDVNMRYVSGTHTVRRGIYVVGRCHLDADSETQAADLQRLVNGIDTVLGREVMALPEEYAEVASDECIRCLTCIRTCPHQAVELRATEDVVAAYVVPEACWGCGMCVANCPVRAISLIEAEQPVEQEAV